ncbi:MAG: putative membrane protein YdjX (TVP38/TMEM64 family) [Lysobacterales bacterium]|jgi:uncharacterized membrane protein YdjX (TVP38/TMEM64 family)
MTSKKIVVSVIIFTLLGITIFLGIKHHHDICLACITKSLNADVIKHYIESFGPWAIVVYVALYTLNTVTLIPPIAFMSLSAGALFGPVWGTVALTLGSFCGTTTTFVISRFFGGKLVDKFVKGKAADFNDKLSQKGFIVLLPIRLIGFPPYEFVNYACGLSKISYKDYISATMLGMAPAIIIQVLLADRLANFSWKDPVLYVVVAMFIAMGVVTGKIIKRQQSEKTNG